MNPARDGIPCVCPHCGLTWAERSLVGGGGSVNVQFTGVAINCPRCYSRTAQVVDGTYSYEWGKITTIIGGLDRHQRRQLARAVNKTACSSPSEILKTVGEVVPGMKPIVENWEAKGNSSTALIVLVLIALWVIHPIASDARAALDHKIENAIVQLYKDATR